MLNLERLKECVAYDAATGIATWNRKTSKKIIVGAMAGTLRPDGYRIIRLDGERYYLHRLAWFYVNGTWPAGVIDHIDGDPSNNRLVNLRDVTQSLNLHNRRAAQANSKTGVLGVRFRKGKWEPRIKVGNKQLNLGRFSDLSDAKHVYTNVKQRYYPVAGAHP